MSRRSPDETERSLWRAAMRNVRPLRGFGAPPSPTPAVEPEPPPPEPRLSPASLPPHATQAHAGIDRRTAERLRRGQIAIEARLDLHGQTQAEAHRALADFIEQMAAAQKRLVLVITGKGLLREAQGLGGILRHAVPRWLDEPQLRRHILKVAPAQPRDGGAGALYVLLRRRR